MIFFLTIFWFLLSGQFSTAFIVFAFLSIAATYFIDKKLYNNAYWIVGFRPSWIVFIFKIFKEIIISTMQVTKIIWFKPQAIKPKTFWIKTNFKNPINIITLANSITLTPGTMTLDIKEDKLFIHSLYNNNADIDKIKLMIHKVEK